MFALVLFLHCGMMAPPRKLVKVTNAEVQRKIRAKLLLLSPKNQGAWRKIQAETQKRYYQRQKALKKAAENGIFFVVWLFVFF